MFEFCSLSHPNPHSFHLHSYAIACYSHYQHAFCLLFEFNCLQWKVNNNVNVNILWPLNLRKNFLLCINVIIICNHHRVCISGGFGRDLWIWGFIDLRVDVGSDLPGYWKILRFWRLCWVFEIINFEVILPNLRI